MPSNLQLSTPYFLSFRMLKLRPDPHVGPGCFDIPLRRTPKPKIGCSQNPVYVAGRRIETEVLLIITYLTKNVIFCSSSFPAKKQRHVTLCDVTSWLISDLHLKMTWMLYTFQLGFQLPFIQRMIFHMGAVTTSPNQSEQ